MEASRRRSVFVAGGTGYLGRPLIERLHAAREAGISHFIYVSVAHSAPVMKAYVAARAEGERLLAESGLPATVLRPWYVLGPGHRWPLTLLPLFALLKRLPRTRETARRLDFVTREQMVAALVDAVERGPGAGPRLVEVPAIRSLPRR